MWSTSLEFFTLGIVFLYLLVFVLPFHLQTVGSPSLQVCCENVNRQRICQRASPPFMGVTALVIFHYYQWSRDQRGNTGLPRPLLKKDLASQHTVSPNWWDVSGAGNKNKVCPCASILASAVFFSYSPSLFYNSHINIRQVLSFFLVPSWQQICAEGFPLNFLCLFSFSCSENRFDNTPHYLKFFV